jgi:predicted TPR repeat methyltransferase
MTAILALTSEGRFDQAWDRFREISSHNPRFFLTESERFVEALEKSGRIASAVCILRTVTRMRPKDVPARNRLLRLIRSFQVQQEPDDHV